MKMLLYAGIAVVVVVNVVLGVIDHRRGWRGGGFSRSLARYQPPYNVKTGERGPQPAQGLRTALDALLLALNFLVFLAICFLLLSWAYGS